MTATTPTATPSSIGGFAVLPLRYSSSATALHNLYVRAHAGTRPANLPEGRTLFVVNVPPDASARELGALFARYGAVERVVFGSSSSPNQEDQNEDEQENGQQQADEEEANSDSSSSSSSEDDGGAPAHPRKKRKLDKKNGDAKTKAKPKPSGPPTLVPLPSRVTRELRPSGGSAHVVFLDGSSLQRALSSVSLSAVQTKPPAWPPKLPTSTTTPSSTSTQEEPRGLAYYAARHAAARPPLDAVLQHAESAILRFDFALAAAKRVQKSKYRKGEEVVDEDGFTLVVRGGAYGQSVGGGVGVASKKFELAAGKGVGGMGGEGVDGDGKRGKGRKKKERKEKEGFYAFQVRERNLKEHAELRKKFEEDKRRVEELQKKRAFVPY